MIDNETLLGYTLNALEPAEQANVQAKLKDDTAAMANLSRIQRILKPFAADRDAPKPPIDLVAATLARLDAKLAEPSAPRGAAVGRWLELALAATVGMLGFGLVSSAVSKLRADSQTIACQNNLRGISNSLHSYADNHNNKFPQVNKTAAEFTKILDDNGNWQEGVNPRCGGNEPVGYSYSLGHRFEGQLIGPSRNVETIATTPVVADFPNRRENLTGGVSPHERGQNVLFADNSVRFMTKPKLGDDYLYLNDENKPRAGLHPKDFVLGHPDDEP